MSADKDMRVEDLQQRVYDKQKRIEELERSKCHDLASSVNRVVDRAKKLTGGQRSRLWAALNKESK